MAIRPWGQGNCSMKGAGDDLLQDYGGHKDFGPYAPEHFKYEAQGTSTDWGPYPSLDLQMPDYKVASYAIDRLNETHDQPFFLAAGFNRPHVPWYVPQKWFNLIDLETVETPPYLKDDLNDAPPISRIIHEMVPTPSTEWLIEQGCWKEVVQAYLACVAFVDSQIGRVLDALEASPYADNTIVILWSDHGYHLGEKNIVAKMTLYEESSHVPLIIAGPGVSAPGESCERTVGLIDLYPTLVEMAGLPANPQNDGRSLVPLLTDPQRAWKHPALTFWGRYNTAVRTEQYRYIRYEDGSEELYDHETDPNEWDNLAGDDSTASIRNQLRQHIPFPQVPLSNVSRFTWNDYWTGKTREAAGNVYDPELTWGPWPFLGENLVDTDSFLGMLFVVDSWVYSFDLPGWFYLPGNQLRPTGAWSWRQRE